MRIAVLGLGRMGSAMASHLLDTGYYELNVWNRTADKGHTLAQRGARQASSIGDAVKRADAVLTFLTADAAVREVYLGADGIVAHLGNEAVAIDMSTVSPETSRMLGERIDGGRFVDAPILGGPQATAQGKSTLLLGGDHATVEELDRLWNDMGAGFTYCGPNGSASAMKLLSNLVLIGGTLFLAEAVATAQASDLPRDVIEAVFGNSASVAPGARARLDEIMSSGKHQGWWTVLLAGKDTRLALQLASQAGLTLELGETAEHLLAEAERDGYGEQDLAAVVEVIRGNGAREVTEE